MKYEIDLIPAPREIRYAGGNMPRNHQGAPRFSMEDVDNARIISDQMEQSGWMLSEEPEILISARRVQDDSLAKDPITGYVHSEGYRLITEDRAGQFTASIEYVSNRGLKYALSTLAGLMISGGEIQSYFPEIEVIDGPRFPIRALIEGYYGPPWSPSARENLMRLMAEHRMNAYFYGPKDDIFHRERWREHYQGKELDDLKSVIKMTEVSDMDFWYCIGPGLSMQYSNEDDFLALEAKLTQIHKLGVHRFGLLFDDIPEVLQHPDDKSAFPDLPHAHAEIANRLFLSMKQTDPGMRLAVCPTQYYGNGNESYITMLGSLLNPRIDIFWTGPEICSRQLTLNETSLLSRNIDRPVLFWDNYPVNDCEMNRELHIGPYRGRDPHLYRASHGIVANGMEYPESSKIGFLTIADYLWNPESYEPERSWDRALQTVVGVNQWEDFRVFADNNRYSCLYTTDSPDLKAALESMRFLRLTGEPDKVKSVLSETIKHLKLGIRLFDRGLENRVLQKEIQPWIEKFRKGVALLEASFGYLTRPGESAERALREARDCYLADPMYVFADVLNDIADSVLEPKPN